MWGSCFSLGTLRAASTSAASTSARRRVPHSSHLTHHSTIHHTSPITALPITPHSSHLITPHPSQHYSSHHLSITPRCCLAGAVHRASWRICCARGRRWAAAGFRVAGSRVAGAVHAVRVVAAWPAAGAHG